MQGQGKRRLLLPRLYTVVQTTHPQTLGAVESAHFHVLNLKGLEAELTKSTKRHCAKKKPPPSYVAYHKTMTGRLLNHFRLPNGVETKQK